MSTDPLDLITEAAGRLGTADWLMVASYVVLVVVVAADIPPRRVARPGPPLGRLAASFGVSLVVAVPVAAVLRTLWSSLGAVPPASWSGFWVDHPVWAFLCCFVLWDLAQWLYHLLGHATRVGWASHRVHHLGERFDTMLVLRQPWLPVHGLVVLPLVALAGFGHGTAAGCAALSVAYQAAQHTSRTWSLGPLEAVLVSNRAHRHHHTVAGGMVNLGAVLSVWDRLFGTRVEGSVPAPATFGAGVAEPTNPLRSQLDGWLDLRHRSRRRPSRPLVST